MVANVGVVTYCSRYLTGVDMELLPGTCSCDPCILLHKYRNSLARVARVVSNGTLLCSIQGLLVQNRTFFLRLFLTSPFSQQAHDIQYSDSTTARRHQHRHHRVVIQLFIHRHRSVLVSNPIQSNPTSHTNQTVACFPSHSKARPFSSQGQCTVRQGYPGQEQKRSGPPQLSSLLSGVNHHIHRHIFPLAVPPAIQSLVGWNTATAGTAVRPSPPSWASCAPVEA